VSWAAAKLAEQYFHPPEGRRQFSLRTMQDSHSEQEGHNLGGKLKLLDDTKKQMQGWVQDVGKMSPQDGSTADRIAAEKAAYADRRAKMRAKLEKHKQVMVV
jgi:hypothetical protein